MSVWISKIIICLVFYLIKFKSVRIFLFQVLDFSHQKNKEFFFNENWKYFNLFIET